MTKENDFGAALALKLSCDLRRLLEQRAVDDDRSMSAVVRLALRAYLSAPQAGTDSEAVRDD